MRLEIIQNNYLFVPKFLTCENALNLYKEFKDYADKFKLSGDAQVLNSQAAYNYMPFVKLLVEKTPHVSDLLGEKVLPTYSYARIYKHGSTLTRHRDRPACEISITLNLKKDCDWPIYFQRPDSSETNLELNSGDAVLYLGCQSDHWREAFVGQEYTQVFLHYVRADGPKAWAFFDKKQQQDPTPPETSLPVTVL